MSKIRELFKERGNKKLRFLKPMTVFSFSRHSAWDDYGVRDPAILVDEAGRLVYENEKIIMYYTGSSQNGRKQASGRAISYDDGITWIREPEGPVLEPNKNSWDCGIATTPWVIKEKNGKYRMFYRGGPEIFKDSIGTAVSDDGINFNRACSSPILGPDDFQDIPSEGRVLMGVMNAIITFDSKYLLTFEAFSKSCNGMTQIFGALSEDGINFTPMNKGYPIFHAGNVKNWPVDRVANPRITAVKDENLYLLTFNGAGRNGMYSIGFAITEDFVHWTEYPGNPVLCPSGYPVDDPFSGRLEGGNLIKEDMEGKDWRMYLMAIPKKGPSHYKSVVGLSYGKMISNEIKVAGYPVVDNMVDVRVSGDRHVHIERTNSNKTHPHYHYTLSENTSGIEIELLTFKNETYEIYVGLSDIMNYLFDEDGTYLVINSSCLYLIRGKKTKLMRYIKDCQFQRKFLSRILGKKLSSWTDGQPNKLSFMINSNMIDISLNGEHKHTVKLNKIKNSRLRDVSVHVTDGRVEVKDVNYKMIR